MKTRLLRSSVWPTLLFVVVSSFSLLFYFNLIAAGIIEPLVPREQAWLVGADPVADFERAKERGDLRFWGVYGGLCAQLVPGVDEDAEFELIERQGVRFIDRTSLCTETRANHRRGFAYAEHYNTLLRQHLEK